MFDRNFEKKVVVYISAVKLRLQILNTFIVIFVTATPDYIKTNNLKLNGQSGMMRSFQGPMFI